MELEQEARNLGWRPEAEYNGPPGRWLDASAFVERGRAILAISNKNNETLQARIAQLETTVAEASAAAADFRKYHEETAERAYTKAIADLNAQKLEAMEKDEHGRVIQIDDALRKLEIKAPSELKETPGPNGKGAPTNPTLDPVFAAWSAEHPWVKENGEKARFGTAQAAYLRIMEPDLKGRALLDRVAEEVEAHFKEGGATRRPSSRVEGGTRGNGRIAGKSFADLPKEAQEACDRMGGRLVGPKGSGKSYESLAAWRTQYITDYDWS